MSEFLQCDAEGCGHVEDVAEITAGMVGKPCPKCGASLLTAEDWKFYSERYRPVVNAMLSLGLVTEAEGEVPASDRIRFHYHNGEMRISLPKTSS